MKKIKFNENQKEMQNKKNVIRRERKKNDEKQNEGRKK